MTHHTFHIASLHGVFLAFLAVVVLVALAFVFGVICHYFAKHFLIKPINALFKRTGFNIGFILFKNGVFDRVAYLIPGIIIYHYAYLLNIQYDTYKVELTDFTRLITTVYIIFCIALILSAVLKCIQDYYQKFEISAHKPIKSYLEVLRIVIFALAFLYCISYVSDKPFVYFFTGLGALMAIILLIFKDSFLGFMASIQLASNDLVRLHDWIEMKSYNANGEVIDIALNTVKVRNFDNSIAIVPSYMLLSSGFINWRGMTEAGNRRIKRSIYIDVTTIKRCNENLLTKISEIDLLKDKLNEVRTIETNIGLFRFYMKNYLLKHPKITRPESMLIPQLQAEATGLPIEIYCFVRATDSAPFEAIQADIMDHAYVMLVVFELKPFQYNQSFH